MNRTVIGFGVGWLVGWLWIGSVRHVISTGLLL